MDASEHDKGPLMEFFLAPQASNLTFEVVVHQVLGENRDKLESSLNHFQELQAQLQRELEDLQRARKDESSTSTQKRMKKEMEQKWERPPRSQGHHLRVRVPPQRGP